MNDSSKLWDPKYAVVGVIAIALAILMLDTLPRFVISKIKGIAKPKEE
jgi:hypothetical protein